MVQTKRLVRRQKRRVHSSCLHTLPAVSDVLHGNLVGSAHTMKMQPAFAAVLLCLLSSSAYALQVAPIPEPGVLELMSIAGVAGVVIAIRNRRKK